MQPLSLPLVERSPADTPVLGRPASTEGVLKRLRDYLHGFHPERAAGRPLPLAFWELEEDELFMQALGSLPLFMGEIIDRDHASLPEAFRLAFPIFWIEEHFRFNGWAALGHAREAVLPWAIAAYARIGMMEEAEGFGAALHMLQSQPCDDAAIEAAYRSVPKRFTDEAAKRDALRVFFRSHPGLWVHATAND